MLITKVDLCVQSVVNNQQVLFVMQPPWLFAVSCCQVEKYCCVTQMNNYCYKEGILFTLGFCVCAYYGCSVNTIASSIHERVFIDDNKCCQFLKTYATNNDVLARYLSSDVDHLVTCLTEHCPVLAELIVHMEKPVPCPSVCSSLLSDLSTMSPVCALLTPIPQVISLVNELCNGLEVRKFPEKWKLLQDHVQSWTRHYVTPYRVSTISNIYGAKSTATICIISSTFLCSCVS